MYRLNHLLFWLGWPLRRAHREDAPVLVLQPLPGIGDMVWHLPALRALATSRGKLIVMTKPRSLADQLLLGNHEIEKVIWLERPGRHHGLCGIFRLAADLRRLHVNEAWVMHGSARYTLALYLAGVPHIIAPGKGLQKLFADPALWLRADQMRTHPTVRAENMLARAGIPLPQHEGSLQADADYLAQVKQDYPQADHLVAFAIGSSEPFRQWGAANFTELARRLLQQGFEVVLVGGTAEQAMADEIRVQITEPGLHVEINRPLPYITALLVSAKACIGNDTGVLNIALASGTTTFGMFGGTPPLSHAASLRVIQAADTRQAMAGISVQQVYDAVAPVIGIKE